jgi:serine protease Do
MTELTTSEYNKWKEIIENSKNTFVQIFALKQKINWLLPSVEPIGISRGSGFFINQKHIITNYHVIHNSTLIEIQLPSFGKKKYAVEVKLIAPERDVAILKLTTGSDGSEKELKKDGLKKINILRMGNSNELMRGQTVIAIGYPLGQESLKITVGVINGPQTLDELLYYQIDAPINPGNSGGASIDSSGRIVGINTAGITGAQNVGYIIPINDVNIIIENFNKNNEMRKKKMKRKNEIIRLIRYRKLGLVPQPSNQIINKYFKTDSEGLLIAKVFKDTIFYKSGFQENDIISNIEVDNTEYLIDNYGQVYNKEMNGDRISIYQFINKFEIGKKLVFSFYRNGNKKIQEVTLEPSKALKIRIIYPLFEKNETKYIIFKGMIIMNFKLNHIMALMKNGIIPFKLMKYNQREHQDKQFLIVTHIHFDTEAKKNEVLTSGTIIKYVNNKKIETLDDFIKEMNETKEKYLKITTENGFIAVFNKDKDIKYEYKSIIN